MEETENTELTEKEKSLQEFIAKAESKRDELSKKLDARGKPLYGNVKVFILNGAFEDDKPAVAYFAQATLLTKQKCIDMMYQSFSKANALYFNTCIIRDESDKRFLNEDDENNHPFILKAHTWCGQQIQFATELVKKK